MRRHQFAFLVLGCAFMVGCPASNPPPPASAILAGDWEGATEAGVELVVTFNANGVITRIVATNADGSATLNVNNGTTELDGSAATITIPAGDRTATYEATLSADNNTLDGSITSELEVGGGDVNIIIDAGDLTLTRIVEAGCETDADCAEGETCADGQCVASGNATRGGALYDKFWVVAGLDAPTTDHPFWESRPDMDSNSRTGSDTWRCKECHGWDYKGVDGAYASGSHRTGFAGIFGTTLTAQEAFDKIKTDHDYGSTGLSDDDIWDLAQFVVEEVINTDDILTETAFTGSAAAGQPFYDSTCSVCHGADGLTIPPGGPDDYDAYVGALSNGNPWEFQHKVRFGQPGTAMPPQADILTLDEVNDLSAYSQTLPTAP